MKLLVFLLLLVVAQNLNAQNSVRFDGKETDKIKVLNFGTFHMGATTDENTTEFDENAEENKKAAHAVAKKIAEFKPTVIIVEFEPDYDPNLQEKYRQYVDNPLMKFDYVSEVQLLAFEVGRLSDTKHIYGIDHKMSYNYKIDREIVNHIDSSTVKEFFKDPLANVANYKKPYEENRTLLEELQWLNKDEYLDFLITINADILTHAGSENGFEGADEAAKYYRRNLRMFSNLNRIELSPGDRVFILMGASHTAFFRDFISRSSKYVMVDTFKYLK